MSRRAAIIFVPGILQHPDGVDDWADAAVAWTHSHTQFVADRYEYRSGALTRWLGQAKRVSDLSSLCDMYRGIPLRLVGHSNGVELILRMLREKGNRIASIHLFAGAASADCDKNGLNEVMGNQRLGWCHLYGSRNDGVLKKWARLSSRLFGWAGLGYGDIGRVGPSGANEAVLSRSTVDWRDEYGHSTWFSNDKFESTMRLVTRG